MCNDLSEGLQRRYNHLTWKEDAIDVAAWLLERENELVQIIKPPISRKSSMESETTQDYVVGQINIIQRQKEFQVTGQTNYASLAWDLYARMLKGLSVGDVRVVSIP